MLAIVPVKGRNGKARLDGFLTEDERARLVEAMLGDVLDACRAAGAVDDVLVVTPDPELVPSGIAVLVDDGAGHEEAVAYALTDRRAAAGAVVVMGDCPLVSPDSLERLAEAAQPVSLAPAQDGGMNALALAEPDAVDPVFGIPGAAAETVERARVRGVEAAVIEDPALAFDVDDPPDVWKLRTGEGDTRSHRVVREILPETGGFA